MGSSPGTRSSPSLEAKTARSLARRPRTSLRSFSPAKGSAARCTRPSLQAARALSSAHMGSGRERTKPTKAPSGGGQGASSRGAGASRRPNSWRRLPNSSLSRKALSPSRSGSRPWARSTSRGRSVRTRESSKESLRSSRWALIFSRTFSGFTRSRFLRRFSRLPHSLRSLRAVFSPMPLTPGRLSEGSPTRARKSTHCSGLRPYFSQSHSGVMRWPSGWRTATRSETSW